MKGLLAAVLRAGWRGCSARAPGSGATWAAGLLCVLTCLPLRAAADVPATVDRDPSRPRLELGGYAFHAQAFGDASRPVLVVLHGGPGADHRYLLGLQALADRYRVVFYDQRGTGLSPRVPAETLSPQTFVNDLDAIVDAQGGGAPVHLLGHSWGAMLASAYAGAHPRKVASLVLAEPGFLDAEGARVFTERGFPGWRVLWGLATAWLAHWFVHVPGDAYARDDWFAQQALPLMQPPDNLCGGRLPLLPGWRAGSPNVAATIGRMGRDPAWAAQLSFRRGTEAFHGPVLFLVGGCSGVTGAAHQRRHHLGHFTDARLQAIAGAGHFMFNDQPAASVAAVRAFLAVAAVDGIDDAADARAVRQR